MRQINSVLHGCVLWMWLSGAAQAASADLLESNAQQQLAGSIARSSYLDVDGARLFMMVRGDDRRAPVLLWLHGGPGGAERPLFRYYDSALERRFVVVYWDQRGAGRSFDPKAASGELTIARHLADLDAVIEHLQQAFGRRVVLLGHSWGAALALLYAHAHPQRIAAVIAVAPLVNTIAQQQAQYAFVTAEAERRNDRDAKQRLQAIGAPPHGSAESVLAMEALADRYGGVFHTRPNRVGAMLGGIARGLVTPWEIPRFIRGNNVSLAAMNDELLGLRLARSVPSLDVPVFFFLGRYDRHADASVATQYLESLHAPMARIVWFEQSAHNIPFEEPSAFTAAVVDALASIGVTER